MSVALGSKYVLEIVSWRRLAARFISQTEHAYICHDCFRWHFQTRAEPNLNACDENSRDKPQGKIVKSIYDSFHQNLIHHLLHIRNFVFSRLPPKSKHLIYNYLSCWMHRGNNRANNYYHAEIDRTITLLKCLDELCTLYMHPSRYFVKIYHTRSLNYAASLPVLYYRYSRDPHKQERHKTMYLQYTCLSFLFF